jgi:hypothetical protein
MYKKKPFLNKYSDFKLLSPFKFKKIKYSKTMIFKNTNFTLFKHFIFLNFIYKNRSNSLINYFYLISTLKYKYFNIRNLDFFDINLILNNLKVVKNFYSLNFYLYVYQLNNFYKKWKIIDYYFLPNKL